MKYEEQFSRKGAKAQSSCRCLELCTLRLCAFAGNKLLLLVVLMALALSGCGGSSAAEDQSKINVGIVFDIGGKDDRSFNAAAWEGVQRAAAIFRSSCATSSPARPTPSSPRCALSPNEISI